MENICIEFEVRDDMKHDEFEFMKKDAIQELVYSYMFQIGINNEIFNKKIAFEIHEKRYVHGERVFERIELLPIRVQEIKYEIPKAYLKPKYSLKERIKILFKG